MSAWDNLDEDTQIDLFSRVVMAAAIVVGSAAIEHASSLYQCDQISNSGDTSTAVLEAKSELNDDRDENHQPARRPDSPAQGQASEVVQTWLQTLPDSEAMLEPHRATIEPTAVSADSRSGASCKSRSKRRSSAAASDIDGGDVTSQLELGASASDGPPRKRQRITYDDPLLGRAVDTIDGLKEVLGKLVANGPSSLFAQAMHRLQTEETYLRMDQLLSIVKIFENDKEVATYNAIFHAQVRKAWIGHKLEELGLPLEEDQ